MICCVAYLVTKTVLTYFLLWFGNLGQCWSIWFMCSYVKRYSRSTVKVQQGYTQGTAGVQWGIVGTSRGTVVLVVCGGGGGGVWWCVCGGGVCVVVLMVEVGGGGVCGDGGVCVVCVYGVWW